MVKKNEYCLNCGSEIEKKTHSVIEAFDKKFPCHKKCEKQLIERAKVIQMLTEQDFVSNEKKDKVFKIELDNKHILIRDNKLMISAAMCITSWFRYVSGNEIRNRYDADLLLKLYQFEKIFGVKIENSTMDKEDGIIVEALEENSLIRNYLPINEVN